MRQVWIPRVGGPEVLEVRDAPDPTPGPGQVRVRVAAAGVNFADAMARMGLYPDAPPLPAVVGYEVAGTVDAVGSGADGARVGQRVMALVRFGGYSEAVVVPAEQAIPLPDAVSFDTGAAIPVAYLTAWIMLVWVGNVRSGDRVLVHSAGGAVGQAAIQICRWRGAEILGTASAGKHERLRAAGVAHCIDYTTQDFEAEVRRLTGGRGVDIVIDAQGGESFARSYRSLAPLGRLFLFGAASLAPAKKRRIIPALRGLLAMPKFKAIDLMNENRGVFGVNMGHLWGEAERARAMFGEILQLTEAGPLHPVVDKTFSFERAGDAHAYLQDRKNFGKILLTP